MATNEIPRNRDLLSIVKCARELRRLVEDADGEQIANTDPTIARDIAYIECVLWESDHIKEGNIYIIDQPSCESQIGKAFFEGLQVVGKLLDLANHSPQLWDKE